MSIKFYCPKCDNVIAFKDKYKGKAAYCLNCNQRFIIPSKDDEEPEILKEPKEILIPVKGFYKSVFIDNLVVFINSKNVTGLVFIAAIVTFKFFFGSIDFSTTFGQFRIQGFLGLIFKIIIWGCLFWYYMEIINSSAYDEEGLPDISMGDFFAFLSNVVKSIYWFITCLLLVQLPALISLLIIKHQQGQYPFITHALSIAGIFIFPMAILTFSIGRDVVILANPLNLLKPVFKAFFPYLITAGIFLLAWHLEISTIEYDKLTGQSNLIILMHLAVNITVQFLAVIAMRTAGLFYRHYSCYFNW